MAKAEIKIKSIFTADELMEMREAEQDQIEEEKNYKMQKPRMRFPRRIRKGEIIRVQVKIRHPIRTGLRLMPDGTFIRGREPFYIRLVEIFYGKELVSKFEPNSTTSDDPLYGFNLRATKEAPVRIVFTNHKDEQSEVSKTIKFSAS